jgi:hypothetical protein
MKISSTPLLALPLAAGLLGFGMQAPAQAAIISGGLVNVQLVNVKVLNGIANGLHISVNNVPISVAVPVNVAANVCGIQAAVLSAAAQGSRASCTARNTGTALNAYVLRAISTL